MAKTDFLLNLRVARNLLVHRAQTDDPNLDPQSLERQLAGAAIWLTPTSVKGFRVEDFPELPTERRVELCESVEQFQSIAREVPPDKPPTSEQIKDALSHFLTILHILEPYFASGDEAEQIRRVLAEAPLPDSILNLNFELVADSTGDPAVLVWLFVDDETASSKDAFLDLSLKVRRLIRQAFQQRGIERWPYVSFRTPSEQKSLGSFA